MSAAAARAASSPHRQAIVEGEFLFTTEDFREIAAMLNADSGIALPESKATLVYSRLAKRLRILGIANFRDYCALIAGEAGADERMKMLAALTTNVTKFFREPHHFEHLQAKALPELIDAARKGHRLRLWSAACSTGQEPYTMAMTLLEAMPDAAKYDVKILATDIDPNVVAHGRRGVYSESEVSPVPSALKSKYLSKAGAGWEVNDNLREIVAFRELNLIGNWPMRGRFDIIFCRNVVIYFAEDTQVKIWNRFRSVMSPGGWLYIGHSERVTGDGGAFTTAGLTTYRLPGARR